MGNTCSPNDPKKGDDAAPVTDMDKQAAMEEAEQEGGQAGEKMTQIINSYAAENERLKREVEEMKTQQTERQEQEQDSSALLKELNTMRELVKAKDMAVMKSKVEAALFARASSMKDAQNAAEVLKKDTLDKFGKGGKGSAKTKFVEVSLHKGTRTASGFEPGMIRLSYAETEGAGQLSTGRVTKVKTADNMSQKYKGRTFSVEAVIDGASKPLVFACKDTAARDAWVQTFQKGFDKIREEAESMREHFRITMTFNKEKLGIRVEEKVIEQDQQLSLDEKKEDLPAPEAPASEEDKADTNTAEDIPAPAADAEDCDAEKQEGEKPAEEAAAPEEGEAAPAEPAAAEEPAQAAEAAEEKEVEPPCTLVVTAISDTDLQEKGLFESMALVKLNDTDIDGLPYSKQLGMLTGTPKPFTITFSGPNFLKLGQNQLTVFPAILKSLTSEEPNDAQTGFYGLIKGSQFEKELEASEDKHTLISELLSNQHKLSNLLQSVTTQSADL